MTGSARAGERQSTSFQTIVNRKRYRLFEADITPPRDRSDDGVRRLLGGFFPRNDRVPAAAGARPSATPDVFSSDGTESNFSRQDEFLPHFRIRSRQLATECYIG